MLIHGITFALLNELATTQLTRDNMVWVLAAVQCVVLASVTVTKVREDWRLHQAVRDIVICNGFDSRSRPSPSLTFPIR